VRRLIPRVYTIYAIVDDLHGQIGYGGGRLGLLKILEHIPGFLLTPITEEIPELGSIDFPVSTSGGICHLAYDGTAAPCDQRMAVATGIGSALLHAGHWMSYRLPGYQTNENTRGAQTHIFAQELLSPLWAIDDAMPGLMSGIREVYELKAEDVAETIYHAFDIPEAVASVRASYYLHVISQASISTALKK
jgi:hypothetical protein